ncbi:MAG: GHMP kinase, partial [Flavobacteriaceae bacterium]|nr:GHMP kinase [Flavobacteriaceae bacterium]
MKTYYSHGKLLITGEYLVLDGAKALAIPTKYGQSLSVEPVSGKSLVWKSIDSSGHSWYEHEFVLKDSSFKIEDNCDSITRNLIKILNAVLGLNPDFINELRGCIVHTKLEFPNDWGLGSSSTLINNIAGWADVDPYRLLDLTFGGSGYDIACAIHDSPILYRRKNREVIIKPADFHPEFSGSLYFVHLNEKQDSRQAIAHYRKGQFDKQLYISRADELTDAFTACRDLESYHRLMESHEAMMSEILHMPTVKTQRFHDFNGSIKSLGAWGGDFILVASEKDPSNYFRSKGYTT